MTGPIVLDDVQRLVVEPGETLLVKLPGQPDAATVKATTNLLQEMLPDGVRFLVAGEDVEVSIIAGARRDEHTREQVVRGQGL